MGKHQRAIRTGAWNREGTIFALGSEDTQITVNNARGETVNTFSCNGDIVDVQFSRFRSMLTGDREEDYVSECDVDDGTRGEHFEFDSFPKNLKNLFIAYKKILNYNNSN